MPNLHDYELTDEDSDRCCYPIQDVEVSRSRISRNAAMYDGEFTEEDVVMIRNAVATPSKVVQRLKKEPYQPPVRQMPDDLREAISYFVRDENFEKWLQIPNGAMNEQIPAELIQERKDDVIWEAIFAARRGGS